ncbi:MAG: xanthan lyase [Bacteroides sp.]|jgi:hypothetical protein|nr:xanthan lyase [Bacteroides sp.]
MVKTASPILAIHSTITLILLLFYSEANAQDRQAGLSAGAVKRMEKRAEQRLENFLDFFYPWKHLGSIGIDSLQVDPREGALKLFFNANLTHLPIRYPFLLQLESEVMNHLGRRFRKYDLQMFSRGKPLFEFIPNALREPYFEKDPARIRQQHPKAPLVSRLSPGDFNAGLKGNHVALWPSHGYYFDMTRNRWQWQRARLFGTVEDLLPMGWVQQYIAPMLENAGAVVLLPRERDLQTNEVIVDFDGSILDSELILTNSEGFDWKVVPLGFASKDTLFDGENPFTLGSHLSIAPGAGKEARLLYIPDFPENGFYGVYFSWHQDSLNTTAAEGVLHYSGGSVSFLLNQTMGGGTWIYLGNYFFKKGKNAEQGSFQIFGDENLQVTADALRFGGGMGNVARRAIADAPERGRSVEDRGTSTLSAEQLHEPDFLWKTSKRPRYQEGARYYLQYAGMPDSLVFSMNAGQNDYNDDYMSRGEWVNYLTGRYPEGESDPGPIGLNIPVDLSLALHTDAGITPGDSVIGTLAIYSSERDEGLFSDGVSRMGSRDLADLVQDQVVYDMRALFKDSWTRRALWDRQYSEAWRPQVPALLLELLSHQNLADMRYGLDPCFQFHVSRAMYKGILRFVAANEGREPVVQPLPVQGMMLERLGDKRISLRWQPAVDPLEPSATPNSFIVYSRAEGKGFDTGTLVSEAVFEMELPHWDTLYSFFVTAVNDGGESFPSEVLSVALVKDQPKTVLVVNGFDRISAPAIFDNPSMAGLSWWEDQGVPFHYNASYTGHQFDFDRDSPWLHDDSPGWGASHADMEGLVLKGNSFDFPAIHGTAIRNAGYSFVSVSRKAMEENLVNSADYWAADLIFGEQLGVPSLDEHSGIEFRIFTPGLMRWLSGFTAKGGHIAASGAHLGTDAVTHKDSLAIHFASEILGFSWRTSHAANAPEIVVTDEYLKKFPYSLEFNAGQNPETYIVESPDAIEAIRPEAKTLYRYGTNQTSAAVILHLDYKAVMMGFPFESIPGAHQRDALMKSILDYFENKQ